MFEVMQIEKFEDERGSFELSQTVAQCPTLEDAQGICDKMNGLNAFYAKQYGSVIKFFYSVFKK